ncbi:MAG: glycoside hydrolase family 97 catalytic domain-containing protein [Verrucomicrobiae bacterium]|nr:glycoside hydrolase family 97 catalytic domain-containing protein [Verrucomicrobiae bacterium]
MKLTPILPILAVLILASCSSKDKLWKLVSPDGNASIQVELNEAGALTYSVFRAGAVVLPSSPLGILLADTDLSQSLSFKGVSNRRTIDETYVLKSGKQLSNRNHANELTINFANSDGAELGLVLRAYDDGVAFRYVLAGKADTSVTVVKELTGFQVPEGGKAWMHPYDKVSQTTPAYETYFQGPIPVGTPAPEEYNGWAFPILFQTGPNWMLISEADLDDNYAGMHLEADCTGGFYRIRFPEEEEALDLGPSEPVVKLPAELPWRFIILSDKLSGVVKSNLVTHLARPSELQDSSWIHPGRASWSWWSKDTRSRELDNLKKYVDLAAEMGWEYSLVDAGWPDMVGGSLDQLVDYADTKGVGILVWYNSGGRGHTKEEARQSIMYDPQKRRAEFQRIHELGVKGVKVDFFNSDKQVIIHQYLEILRDAADNQLLVNFHGCTLPRGWRRTFPNLLSMEGIRGQEAYRYDKTYPEMSPAHQVIAPFTRNVVGPMDFTPVGLSNRTYPHLTSYGFELAQAVVFESGIVHICDSPEAYGTLPDFAIDYLKAVPAAWDETRLVDGFPGDYVIMARRQGNRWYVACLNGKKEARTISLKLPFLDSTSTLKLIKDGSGKKSVDVETYEVSSNATLEIEVLPFGGFVGFVNP